MQNLEDFLFPQTEIIQTILKKYKLPISYQKELELYLSKEKDENLLICCHSDCVVCNQVVYECLQTIKKELDQLFPTNKNLSKK